MSGCVSWRLLASFGTCTFHYSCFSCCRAQALGGQVSLVSCPTAYGILLDQGLAGGFFTTGPLGKSLVFLRVVSFPRFSLGKETLMKKMNTAKLVTITRFSSLKDVCLILKMQSSRVSSTKLKLWKKG